MKTSAPARWTAWLVFAAMLASAGPGTLAAHDCPHHFGAGVRRVEAPPQAPAPQPGEADCHESALAEEHDPHDDPAATHAHHGHQGHHDDDAHACTCSEHECGLTAAPEPAGDTYLGDPPDAGPAGVAEFREPHRRTQLRGSVWPQAPPVAGPFSDI